MYPYPGQMWGPQGQPMHMGGFVDPMGHGMQQHPQQHPQQQQGVPKQPASPHVSRVASPAKALKTATRQGSGAGVSDSRHPHTPQNGAQRGLQQVYANVGGALGQKPKRQEAPPPDEDEVGHYQVVIGDKIDRQEPFPKGRYTVVKLLGSGTYGKVVEAEDNKYNKTPVALKLVRREPPLYRVSAQNEVKILRELDGRFGTLKLLREFDHMGHVCMSFELLGDHLSDLLKQNGKPFKRDSIRDVSFQLLQAIAYVHSKHIIHTDLKAENILLMSNPNGALSVKVADFGSAIYSSAWHPPLVGTMHYRSPEAVLQAGWSYPLDVWAIACLICELSIGTHVFELAHDDVHLAMMQRLLGPIPKDLMRKGYEQRNQYNASLLQHEADGSVRLTPCRQDGLRMVNKVQRLEHIIQDPVLLDLLKHMLDYNPETRIPAHKAMMHPFFDVVDDDEGIDSVGASPDVAPVDYPTNPPPMALETNYGDVRHQLLASRETAAQPSMAQAAGAHSPSVSRMGLVDPHTPRLLQRSSRQAATPQSEAPSNALSAGERRMNAAEHGIGSYGLFLEGDEAAAANTPGLGVQGGHEDEALQRAIQDLSVIQDMLRQNYNGRKRQAGQVGRPVV